MFRIQTVCTGNICRSPMAQFALARAFDRLPVPGGVTVDSAGLTGWEAGKPMDGRAAAELRRHGYPDAGLRDFRAREFEPRWFAERDLVLAMDYGHCLELLELAPTDADRAKVKMMRAFDPQLQVSGERPRPSAALGIDDPWYGDARDFESAYAFIAAAVPGVVGYVQGQTAADSGEPRDR